MSIDLDDQVHQIMYDNNLPYEPCRLYTSLPIEHLTPTQRWTLPPNIAKEEKLLGYSPTTVVDSFFWSIVSILALYNCKIEDSISAYRDLAVRRLSKTITLNDKMRDFSFDNHKDEMRDFLNDFKQGKVGMDKNYYLIESLAIEMNRTIVVISSHERHKNKPVTKFNPGSNQPPLVVGVYERQGLEIFKPFYFNKNTEFDIGSLKGRIEIIAYVAKTLPEGFRSRPIMDLEVFAILTALHSLQRYISGVKVRLLTDNRVLFYLFSPAIGNSSVKIRRWCLKLISDYPLLTLYFVSTTANLADFLTREGMLPGDMDRMNLKNVEIKDFYKELPKHEYTLMEWIEFVERNPQYVQAIREDV
jgi:hypothetical protein